MRRNDRLHSPKYAHKCWPCCLGATRAAARVLLEHECLTPDKGRTFDCKARLPGLGNTRCYRISARVFELEL